MKDTKINFPIIALGYGKVDSKGELLNVHFEKIVSRTSDEYDSVASQDISKNIDKNGLRKTIEEVKTILGDDPVYITFDLDSLDASVAPAVSNIEPSFTGFTIDEAKALIQSVKNKNVIGGDVVCLMPTKDQKNNRGLFV